MPKDVEQHFRSAVDLGNRAEAAWNECFSSYEQQFPEQGKELLRLVAGELTPGWDADLPSFPPDAKGMATRIASGIVLQALGARLPGLIGGSADLNPSTYTELRGMGNFQNPESAVGDLQGASDGAWGYAGRNLDFGVREHGMGSILNGIAAHGGLLPFGATFLTFSDYLRPSLRLSALMGLQVVYVFTHDSIAMGEDGPTHQPVEHLASLRAIPGLTVIRPGDANEALEAWRVAVASRTRPVVLVLSRQNLPTLDRSRFAPAAGLRQGAYILAEPPQGEPRLVLLASGSEVGLIVAAGALLQAQGISVRLVSMPSWELFEAQTPEYRDSVLPPTVHARLAVEAGVTQGWHRYVGDRGAVLGLDRFGASAPGPVLMREFGFTPEHVCQRALALLEQKRS